MAAQANRTCTLTWQFIVAAALTSIAGTTHAEGWQFSVTPYLWLPNIEANGAADSPPDSGGGGEPSYEVGPVDYLEHLNLVLMLAGEVRRENWSLHADVIYLDFSNERAAVRSVSGPGGEVEFPVDAGTSSSFTGLEAQLTLGYWFVDQPRAAVEIFGGVRYFDISFELDWEFDGPLDLLPQSGSIEQGTNPLDAIVGANARFAFGNGKWFVPLHADVGAGDSSLTWQLVAGVGYSFSWGDLLFLYRHLELEHDPVDVVERMALSGPAIGASFRF
ncbi:MAG TPA: hypothetical protein VFU13_11605 [Steroidobacteraceae bacterium]|nr:hypothetical protein [Steroidobacteraceae bacterium]